MGAFAGHAPRTHKFVLPVVPPLLPPPLPVLPDFRLLPKQRPFIHSTALPLTAGAGEGNRTLVVSLEGFCSTIELHPRGSNTNDRQKRFSCGGEGWIRTNVGARPTDLQSAPFNHSGTSPQENRGLWAKFYVLSRQVAASEPNPGVFPRMLRSARKAIRRTALASPAFPGAQSNVPSRGNRSRFGPGPGRWPSG